ncbi:MAG: TIGR02452 family protein [Coprobacillus sp.]|nr:TIGR02452 family protein [Coprobacillus sp.]
MPELTPEQIEMYRRQMEEREYRGLSPDEVMAKKKEKEEERQHNISLFNETLEISKRGSYLYKGVPTYLSKTNEERSLTTVFLPDEIETLSHSLSLSNSEEYPCPVRVENIDALELAKRRLDETNEKVLVLNLASATRPGGGTLDGAGGQEEDLCKRSSLYLALSDEEAKEYFDYNNSLHSHLGSDALMFSPYVAVFRDSRENLLESPYCVSVLSASAPNIRFGKEGLSDEEYIDLLYKRIRGILCTATYLGYKNLILGAFGCGVFANDAKVVAAIFKRVIQEFKRDTFTHLDFAILCKDESDYNYQEFKKLFSEEE